MGVLSGCKPRKEVLKGDLNDAIFAADFGDLIAGGAPPVYGDPKTFFQNTHPARQLCKVVQVVFERLANAKERADSECGQLWVKEDEWDYKKDKLPPTPPPPPPARVTATTWEQLIEVAAQRPLLELHLRASTPAAAAALSGLAQPLGADTLALSVTVGGTLKDGGTMNFAASEVKLAHPTRPLAIAQTVFNALAPGAMYETDLALGFGPAGRTGLESQLRALAESAPEGVSPHATFDRPTSGP